MTIEESSKFVGESRIWLAGLDNQEKHPIVVTCTHIVGTCRADENGIRTDADQVYCKYFDQFGQQSIWFHSTNWRGMQFSK